jgi:beta-lactam-binding protein with PASTA domain
MLAVAAHCRLDRWRDWMDRDTLLNWVGDPVGSTVEWIADNVTRLSRQGTSTTVPDLNGTFVAQARSLLTRADLRMKVVEPSGRGGVGQIVVRQDPPAGRSVRPRTKVTVYVEQEAPRTARHTPSGHGSSSS